MLTFVVLFSLFSVCSGFGDRYVAAEAIQQSIFGGGSSASSASDAIQFEEPVAMMVYSDDHRSGTRKGKKAKSSHARKKGGRIGYPIQVEALVSEPEEKVKYSFEELKVMDLQDAPKQRGKFYTPEPHANLPIVESCQAVECHLNLVVIMDSSGSVGFHDYQLELSFVKTLLEIMAVKAADAGVKVCTGIVSYSSQVTVEVDPCCENSICTIVDQFNQDRMSYRSGSTNTAGALKVARQMLQGPASYKKVALLITDGKSNTGGSPVHFATQMRDEDGVDIVALGVTPFVNEAELKGISGMEFVTAIDVFDEFHELATILLEANYLGSETELAHSFEEICSIDSSTFRSQCDRSDTQEDEEEEEEEEEEEDNCVWGSWSNCVRKGSKGCFQYRTCKMDGGTSKKDKRACTCSDRNANFLSSLRSQTQSRHRNRY